MTDADLGPSQALEGATHRKERHMDVDLLSQAGNMLSEAVDDCMADWEADNPKLVEALAGQWLVDHPDGTMYPDMQVEADWEEAYFEVTNLVIGQMVQKWGWVLKSKADRERREIAILALLAGLIIGWLLI